MEHEKEHLNKQKDPQTFSDNESSPSLGNKDPQSPEGMAKNCSTSRIWIVLAVFFFLTTLTGSGYVIWRELWSLRMTAEVIISRYPTLFRTPLEQIAFEKTYFNTSLTYKPVNTTVDNGYRCNLKCNFSETPQKLTSAQTTYHACCVTTTSFEARTEMKNIFGHSRTIAQFQNQKQFFKFEQCSHVVGYSFGQCQQPLGEYTTAVTVNEDKDDNDDDKYVVEWVQVPGSCKCMNVGPLPTGK